MNLTCRNGGIALAFSLLLVVLLTGVSLGQTIPVWYSGGDVNAKTIDSLVRAPLHTFDGKDLVLTDSAGTISVKTCAQYLDAIRRGYSVPNNFENKKEAIFVETCFLIDFLKEVRPSKESYFKNQALPGNLLDLFPPIIQTGVAGTELHEDGNWRDQDSSLSVAKLSDRQADLEDDTNWYELRIDLAGDLNADGVEDLAGFACMGAKRGTFLFCKIFAITRCGPNEPIVLISEPNLPYATSTSTMCSTVESKRPKHP